MIEGVRLLFVPVVALAGGFAVGSAFVALLIVLDLIPRLVQLTRAHRRSEVFESALLAGTVYWCCADFFGWVVLLPKAVLLVPAILQGVFVGMMSAALTEVLNVIPILTKQLRLHRYLFALLIALALGKMAGSLIDWLILQPR
ncbi:stage V sporulation protein AB [Cohnella sp. AR92]|uniref:stage V sporulation protein AB n=1 Tax=Cohnella sp. AR92 TaxID=648716 RepID=UPI000F8E7438|nr:stage V sporulation protein AB [Cohnella sp. AR92]RUS48118.1 stage V sporulation protein AB [Cohnella sp. AR92]